MKRLAILSYLLLAQPALVTAATVFNDPCTGDSQCSAFTATGSPLYHGANGANPTPAGDIIGAEESFDALSMTVSQSGGNLDVVILTRFVEDAGSPNTHYGDLLISTSGWHPFGSSPYNQDNATTSSTHWDYVVTTQSGAIYQDATLANSDALTQDGQFRHDQYVGYASGGTLVGTAQVTTDNPFLPNIFDGSPDAQGTLLTFSISMAALGFSTDLPAGLALRWTTTGANDIIEAALPVPVPTSWPLFLSGLALVRSLARSKRSAPSNHSQECV